MINISTQGKDIKLNAGKCYYVIDALYLNSIKSAASNLGKRILDEEIKETIFPYTDAPFGKIIAKTIFQVRNIKKIKYEEIDPNNENYFSSDTGLIIFVADQILFDFLENYDYNSLVKSLTEDINFNYWNYIVSKFDLYDSGLILAPGINSGCEFEGSGIYKIEI